MIKATEFAHVPSAAGGYLQIVPDVPPRVEYSVTDLGKTLLSHVEALIKWLQDNFEHIIANRKIIED